MFYFKACPKCHGDLSLEQDGYGEYKKCLQCGTIIEVGVEQLTFAQVVDQPKAAKKAKTAVAA